MKNKTDFLSKLFQNKHFISFAVYKNYLKQNTNYFCDETKVFIFAIDFLPIRRKQEKKKVKKNSEKKIKMHKTSLTKWGRR